MELVEGPTLADCIAHGSLSPGTPGPGVGVRGKGLPLDEALPIARQIAEALEMAHEQGIVHRDLKPANIKVRADGTVKVLDFGLAKLTDAAGAGTMTPPAGLSQSPTITADYAKRQAAGPTDVGVVLGTAAYMAPEQARGHDVDRRADVWAFGCVLFEMLAGQPAFQGSDVTEVLAAVIRAEPAWNELRTPLHPRLRELLGRCLEKDARSRWHHMGDVRVELEKIARDPDGAWAERTGASRTSRFKAPWIAAAVVCTALVAGLLGWTLRPQSAADQRPVRFSFTIPGSGGIQVFSRSANHERMAIAPDGTRVAYVAGEQLHLRSLEQFDGVPVPGTEGAGNLFFSPDGQWVGFTARGRLQRVSVAGGAPIPIASVGSGSVFGASWSPDETIVLGGSVGAGCSGSPSRGVCRSR